MSEKPVGRQIQYWFSVLIILVISINMAGIISVFQIKKRLNQNINECQPIVKLCEGIYAHTLSSQIEAHKFLAGYSKDIDLLTPHLKEIQKLLNELSELQLSSALNIQIGKIKESLGKYEKTASLLETSSTWDQKDQIQQNMVNSGKEIMDMALQLKNQAYDEISENNGLSNDTMKKVISLFLSLCGVSIIITLLECRFWNRLQKTLLKV